MDIHTYRQIQIEIETSVCLFVPVIDRQAETNRDTHTETVTEGRQIHGHTYRQ